MMKIKELFRKIIYSNPPDDNIAEAADERPVKALVMLRRMTDHEIAFMAQKAKMVERDSDIGMIQYVLSDYANLEASRDDVGWAWARFSKVVHGTDWIPFQKMADNKHAVLIAVLRYMCPLNAVLPTTPADQTTPAAATPSGQTPDSGASPSGR